MIVDMDFFREKIVPMLNGYTFKYSFFPNGDFGDLERVEFEGAHEIGAVEFWSRGFIGIDLYDLNSDEQLICKLLGPDENKIEAIDNLVRILNDIYR